METSSTMRSSSELRAIARTKLKGHWGMSILLCIIYTIILAIPGISFIIAGPVLLGLTLCFVKLIREGSFEFENLFDGFKQFGSAFLIYILQGIFIFLWSLLFIIPGIIAVFRYSMAFYILNDNPEIGAMGALEESKQMMKGHKWSLFCLQLSFIGWGILCMFTLGIGYLWLVPYMRSSEAAFYENLKQLNESSSSVY